MLFLVKRIMSRRHLWMHRMLWMLFSMKDASDVLFIRNASYALNAFVYEGYIRCFECFCLQKTHRTFWMLLFAKDALDTLDIFAHKKHIECCDALVVSITLSSKKYFKSFRPHCYRWECFGPFQLCSHRTTCFKLLRLQYGSRQNALAGTLIEQVDEITFLWAFLANNNNNKISMLFRLAQLYLSPCAQEVRYDEGEGSNDRSKIN